MGDKHGLPKKFIIYRDYPKKRIVQKNLYRENIYKRMNLKMNLKYYEYTPIEKNYY